MKSLIQKSYMLLVYVLLYTPIVILIIYSTNDARYSMQWHGFTTYWYQALMHDTEIWSALLNSVILGLSAATIATIVGLLVCVHLFLYERKSNHDGFLALLLILITIPDLVLGVALLIFFNFAFVPLGFPSLLIAHITFCLPFVVLTINSRIHTLDENIYLSALDLGASRYKALVRIILPLLFPAIFSSLLLCFTLSFDDVVISYFVSGPEFNILPLAIYSLVRSGVTPELNALGTITFIISLTMVFISYRLSRTST
ncbi:MAG: ABC transporter permease subunit [Legionellaceae bacterium]|nr:ABC transporter permease subunit [Legionellaceae bacterium]